MTYDELLAYCTRAAGIHKAPDDLNLIDVVGCLQMTTANNRGLNAEVLARFMAEFIEETRVIPPLKQRH